MSISDEHLISMIYEVQHSHILQVEALDPASLSSTIGGEYIDPFYRVFEILFTKYPQYQQLEFTERHYTSVAEYFMTHFFNSP